MEKTRIYELAKELNVDNKVLLNKLDEMQVAYKNHMSSVTSDVAEQLKKSFAPKSNISETKNNEQKKSEITKTIMPNEQVKENIQENKQEKAAEQTRSENHAPKDSERPLRDNNRPPRDPNRAPRDGQRPPRDPNRPP